MTYEGFLKKIESIHKMISKSDMSALFYHEVNLEILDTIKEVRLADVLESREGNNSEWWVRITNSNLIPEMLGPFTKGEAQSKASAFADCLPMMIRVKYK